MIKQVESTSQIPRQFKDAFLQYAEPLRFLAGETICQEGDYDRSLYLLTEGALQVSKKYSGAQADKILANFHAGDVFGEINFVFGSQRIATVSAVDTSTVYRLTPEQANTFLHENDELYVFLQNLGIKRWVTSLLLTLDLFSSLSDATRQKLLNQSEHRTISAGTRLYSAGESTEKLYILLTGMLELQHLEDEPIDAEKGQCFTPVEALSNKPSSWRASTVSECIIASFPLTSILQEAEHNSVFSEKLEQTLLCR